MQEDHESWDIDQCISSHEHDYLGETNFSPGLANIKTRSISGQRAATASARHPPKDSATRYMGRFGDW